MHSLPPGEAAQTPRHELLPAWLSFRQLGVTSTPTPTGAQRTAGLRKPHGVFSSNQYKGEPCRVARVTRDLQAFLPEQCCPTTGLPGHPLFSLFALLESLSPVMSLTTPCAVLQPSHTRRAAFICLFSWACLSQGLRDFTLLTSLQSVSIRPVLWSIQLHGGLEVAAGWPAL